MKMRKHRQIEVTICDLNGKMIKVKVDKGISEMIYYLNNHYHLHTLHSCQGDKYNGGYVMFAHGTNMSKAYGALNYLMPKAVCILDFDNIVRFFKTAESWNNHYDFLKYTQKIKHKALKRLKELKEQQ